MSYYYGNRYLVGSRIDEQINNLLIVRTTVEQTFGIYCTRGRRADAIEMP